MSLTGSIKSDTPSKRPPTPAKDLDRDLEHAVVAAKSGGKAYPGPEDTSKDGDEGLPWNASHPCYPHPNAHMPLSNPLHVRTRIIRIPRDWMIVGDLAPTFSNTYPEILEPWIREADFRLLIAGINERLIHTFDPTGWRAWMDAVLGILTGWLWEDAGFSGVKKGCKDAEAFVERWNGERSLNAEKDEEAELVKVIPLRRTGYLCLDIQIPDPHVGVVEPSRSASIEMTEQGEE